MNFKLISKSDFKSLSEFNNSSAKYNIEIPSNLKKDFFFEITNNKCEMEIIYFYYNDDNIIIENVAEFNLYNSDNLFLDNFSLNKYNKFPLRKKLNLKIINNLERKKINTKIKKKYKLEIINKTDSNTTVSINFIYKGCINFIKKLNLKDIKKIKNKIHKNFLEQKVI